MHLWRGCQELQAPGLCFTCYSTDIWDNISGGSCQEEYVCHAAAALQLCIVHSLSYALQVVEFCDLCDGYAVSSA